jgi:hypothetical protein
MARTPRAGLPLARKLRREEWLTCALCGVERAPPKTRAVYVQLSVPISAAPGARKKQEWVRVAADTFCATCLRSRIYRHLSAKGISTEHLRAEDVLASDR